MALQSQLQLLQAPRQCEPLPPHLVPGHHRLVRRLHRMKPLATVPYASCTLPWGSFQPVVCLLRVRVYWLLQVFTHSPVFTSCTSPPAYHARSYPCSDPSAMTLQLPILPKSACTLLLVDSLYKKVFSRQTLSLSPFRSSCLPTLLALASAFVDLSLVPLLVLACFSMRVDHARCPPSSKVLNGTPSILDSTASNTEISRTQPRLSRSSSDSKRSLDKSKWSNFEPHLQRHVFK